MEKIDLKLFNYLIKKLNKEINDNDEIYKVGETLNKSLKIFKDYLINEVLEDKKLKDILKNGKIVAETVFQPIVDEEKQQISKFEVLTSFKFIIDNNLKEKYDKEDLKKTDILIQNYKEQLLLLLSDYCYNSKDIDTSNLDINLSNLTKRKITNDIFLKNIKSSFKKEKTLSTFKLLKNDKVYKANSNTILTINVGLNELNELDKNFEYSDNLLSFFEIFEKYIDNNKKFIEFIKNKIELEILEHPIEVLDEEPLTWINIKEYYKPKEIEKFTDKEFLTIHRNNEKRKNKYEVIFNRLEKLFTIFDKFGLKIHIDDYDNNKMMNRIINCDLIFKEKLKSVKIDKKLMIPTSVYVLFKDIEDSKNEEELSKKLENIIDIIENQEKYKEHYLVKFFREFNLKINNINKFEEQKDKIYDILEKSMIELLKIHLYIDKNGLKYGQEHRITDNKLIDKFLTKKRQRQNGERKLISYIDMNNYLKRFYNSEQTYKNIKNFDKKQKKVITYEYIEDKKIIKFLTSLTQKHRINIFESIKPIYNLKQNFQGYYISKNLKFSDDKEKNFVKLKRKLLLFKNSVIPNIIKNVKKFKNKKDVGD